MRISPFFRVDPPGAPGNPLATTPVRYPYHDDSDCAVGQQVQRSGQWQAYEPRLIADTRPRCSLCIELGRLPR